MLERIDLRELAEMGGPERAFVSLYASGPGALQSLRDREAQVRTLLGGNEAELQHFDESLRMIREALDEHPLAEGQGVAIFACWALDFLVGYPLAVPTPDLLVVGPSPHIRPLAELQDEHESFVVALMDNREASVHLVTATAPQQVDRVKGDVKNHVKKGGWSQKRYQRRRKNELMHYAKEVAQALADLVAETGIERVVLLGSQEAIGELTANLPETVRSKVVGTETAVELGGELEPLIELARGLATEQERSEEQQLWERIRAESLAGGLAAVGPREVLAAAQAGRAEAMLVARDVEIEAMRCRDCELLAVARPQQCPGCRSTSVFPVDLVNELVALLATTSAEAEFADAFPELGEAGGVAALLRY
jgi:peptide subunit release factor 1 (eRF1)